MNGISYGRPARRLAGMRRMAACGMLGVAASLAFGSEAGASADVPMPTGDMTLSPSGPILVSGASSEPPRSSPAGSRGADTYTYLRCWYPLGSNALEPKGTYEWARNPGSGDWYRVSGYWWADGITNWKNMFYSATTQATLLDVCRKTLASLGIRQPVAQALAANNQFSLNYTVWTLDPAQQDRKIDKMIVFGDSLSDTQNVFNATQWKLPSLAGWYMGRFSNGPVWAESLATALNVPMYNWAIGGAATDQYLVVPGLPQQVDSWREYVARAPNYRAENTLFAVFAGGNDFVNYARTAQQAADAVNDSLDKLARSGAKRIVVMNLPDVSRTPTFSGRNDGADVAQKVKTFNQLLAAAVAKLRERYGATLKLEIYDAYALFDDVLNHPQNYGFDDVAHACLDIDGSSSLGYMGAPVPRAACRDPGRFVFWDSLHPTTRAHALLAQKLAEYIRGAM